MSQRPLEPLGAGAGASAGVRGGLPVRPPPKRVDQYINVLNEEEADDFQVAHELPGPGKDFSFSMDWSVLEKDIVEHPKVQALIEAARDVPSNRSSPAAVKKRVGEICKELCTRMSHTYFRPTYLTVQLMFRRLWGGIIFERKQLEDLTELCKRAHEEGRSVVFLPSHKSHVDYLVLQTVIYRLGLGTPAIAAGENLNLPFAGTFLRGSGAFFIRRTFKGPEHDLYSAVVSAYLEGMLRRGVNLKFFPEGGRSRSGKLLQPKVGMLGMLLDPILSGAVEDAYIVPVSVYYDRVMETRTYVTELLGAQKRKESLRGVVEQAQHLLKMPRSRYGNIHVRVAPCFSAKAFIMQHMSLQRSSGARAGFDARINPGDRSVLLKALAYFTLEEINRVSSVTPTALVGTVLLCSVGRGMSRTALIRNVDWLRKEVVRSGGHMSRFFDFPGELTAEVVDSALVVLAGLVEARTAGLVEPVYCIMPDRHFEMSYYRNMCVHVFIHQSLIATVLHRFIHLRPHEHEVRREVLMQDVRFLSRLLKYEFVFSGAAGRPRDTAQGQQKMLPGSSAEAVVAPQAAAGADRSDWGEVQLTNSALQQNFDAALELMAAEGIVAISGADKSVITIEPEHKTMIGGNTTGHTSHSSFLSAFVWPVIESYWLVLASLQFIFERRGIDGLGTGQPAVLGEPSTLHTRLQAFARTLTDLGHVHYREAASEEALRKALQTYGEMGIVQWVQVDALGTPRRSALQLGEKYLGADGLKDLAKLVEDIGSFRRFGLRKFEGMEHYPRHIAELAFGGPAAKL